MLVRYTILSLLLVVARPAFADSTPAPKSDCPKECERRAKAAFAFAKLKAEAIPAPAAAPMPKPVTPKVGKLCPCGDGCQCFPGDCPGACPVQNVSVGGISAVVARPALKSISPQPAPRYRFTAINGKTYERCDDGFFREVPASPQNVTPYCPPGG